MSWVGTGFWVLLACFYIYRNHIDNPSVPVSSHQDQGVDAHCGRGEDQELVHLEQGIEHVYSS